ncbi:hypothetical protein [Kosakonia sp.]|uniref:hypothetical protein n=1 Tax=Kosakonia sp. TaxID=1916651 RepID=UPI0028ABECDD|nr:hypothetical protein [Kosakonia sp.]
MPGFEFLSLLLSGYVRVYYKKITIFRTIKSKLIALFFKHIDYRFLLCISEKYCFLFGKSYGLNNSFRQTHYNVLGLQSTTTHFFCVMRQKILKNALVNENKQLLEQLEACAAKIRSYIDANNISSHLIFAPLHTVSDILQTVIAAQVTGKPVVVVSVHNSMQSLHEKQNNNSQGISIEQFNPEAMEGNEGNSLQDIIFSLVENQKNLVIFPDALPECTTRLTKKKMKTFPVRLLERSCELHSGLPVFSRLLKQSTLFYCIKLDDKNNLNIDILDCVDHRKIEKKMPELVEQGICRYNNEWTLWHYTSFFSYNF